MGEIVLGIALLGSLGLNAWLVSRLVPRPIRHVSREAPRVVRPVEAPKSDDEPEEPVSPRYDRATTLQKLKTRYPQMTTAKLEEAVDEIERAAGSMLARR